MFESLKEGAQRFDQQAVNGKDSESETALNWGLIVFRRDEQVDGFDVARSNARVENRTECPAARSSDDVPGMVIRNRRRRPHL